MKPHLTKIITVILLLLCFLVNGQDFVKSIKEIKSLEKKLENAKDSIKVADLCFTIYKSYTFGIKTETNELPKYLFRALKIYEKASEYKKIADVHNALGGFYYNRKIFNKSQEHWLTSGEYYKRAEDNLGLAKSYNNLSLIFPHEDSLKIHYIQKSIALSEQIGDSVIIGSSYNNLSNIYKVREDFKNAEKYLIKSIKIAEDIDKISTQQVGYLELGTLKEEQGLINEAITYVEKSLTYNSIRSTDPNVIRTYDALIRLYDGIGNYDKAFHFQKLLINAKDSLFDMQVNEKLFSLAAEYEAEKKELTISSQQTKIDFLERENQLKNQKNLLIGLLVAIFFVFIYLWKSRQFARKKYQLKVQFANQIVSSQEQERTRIAKDLHDSIGQRLLLLKNTLLINTKKTEEIHLIEETIKEVRTMSHNLHPFQFEKLGLIKSLQHMMDAFQKSSDVFYSYDIEDISEKITKEKELFIYRMLQECISNVEKHAQATACNLAVFTKKDTIYFQLKDNGKGFSIENKQTQSSLGIRNLRERAQYINAVLDIKSIKEKGTTITIKITN